jgi:nucleoside-diphosphate-sugar epimerase
MKHHSPVLVTGASGFVGGHLAQFLASQKVKVKLLVRPTSKLAFKPTANMELCYGDVTDLDSVRKAAKGVKVIYHLAGILRGSDFSAYEKVNAEGTRNVCKAALEQKGLKRLVYVSSLSAAGPSTAQGPIDESAPARPVSFYGQTKRMGEEIVLSYQSKFPVAILRPGAVYGPRETDIFEYFKMVESGFVVIGGSDSQQISFVYVDDLVNAIVLAADSAKAVGKTYFVSDGKSYNWGHITQIIGKKLGKSYATIKLPLGLVKVVASAGDAIAKVTGKSILPPIVSRDKLKEAEVPGWACKNDKLRKELGFKPKYDITKGIQKTVEAYVAAGWLKKKAGI